MNRLQNKRIFLVDDDPYWTAVLNQILLELGFDNIITFSSGIECIQNLHLNPGLVFLDYKMKDIDGIEVLKKVKTHYPGIGVIFCTGYEDLAIAMNAMEYGSFDYLLKSNASLKQVSAIIESMTQTAQFA